ncbi:transcription factor TFIIIC [Pyrodictium occultum]|uniref:Transcription factor TFIIIC n=1 Tax=Pyrodictium occultum TaxID=2309 RepID=A0A0V8RTM8_PYROC|nr:transcription factor TFIIIC [Pyrodictium occultum]KSW11347.1 transcription factor TFIIIC [Pyrodictium occultum]
MSAAMEPSIGSGRKGLEELEAKALEIIKAHGDEGIYQHELWKTLGLDSREGSRLALRLLKKGLIRREPTVHKGRHTYKLYIAEQTRQPVSVDIKIGSVIEVPCFTCKNLERCHIGGFFDPTNCPILVNWLASKIARLKRSMSS